MKSIFLKLSSFRVGAARRLCPFRSIINKLISFIFAIIFFSMHCFLVPVSASASPFFQPVYDTQLYQLPQFVDPLSGVQHDIFYFILGSQLVEYAGLSGYRIENPYSDPDSVGEWFKKIGYDLYNDVIESFVVVGAPVVAAGKWLKDLYANIAGVANFAGYFNNTSFNDFLSDVQEDGLSLQLYPSMFGALNQFLAVNDGLDQWQYDSRKFVSNTFNWFTLPLGAFESGYFNNLLSLNQPYVHCNLKQPFNNKYMSNVILSYPEGYDIGLFLNSNTGSYRLFNVNDGTELGIHFMMDYVYAEYTNYNNVVGLVGLNTLQLNYNGSLILSDFNNINEAIQYLFDTQVKDAYFPNLGELVNHVYIGSSIDTAVEVFNDTDLNFSEHSLQDVLVPITETLLDIKGLLSDLLDTNDLKAPALDNLTLPDGSPLPAAQLQPVSVAIEFPESGIVVPEGLFGSSKGFIDYLWYMTKPLVQYTHDFLGTMWFDGVDGFDFSGPAPIVFGVITLGLIGGLIVKFLL